MESGYPASQFHALKSNLVAGLRLVTGRPVSREDFVCSLDQGLWLLVLAFLLEVLLSYLLTESPVEFDRWGMSGMGAMYLLETVILVAVARLAGADGPSAAQLVVVSLSATPLNVLVVQFMVWPEAWLWEHPYAGIVLSASFIVWQVFILIRALRLFIPLRLGRGIALSVLGMVCGAMGLWLFPQTEIWWPGDAEEEGDDPYAAIWQLNVEDVFYTQHDMLEQGLADLSPQRPGVPDLYLLAFGGYGYEKVFLNEVEYVRGQFDRAYDTDGHSLVLVNNAATIERYPLANAHNLELALNGIGERMDPDEDVLFLFMTSHGSASHEFSLELGPVQLNDLTAPQLREALDEAGIRWRVIVVSACYSGGFIPPLRDPHTLVITAAAADLQSFGCGAGSEFTAFGDAYFRKALPEKRDFVAAFHRAAELLEEQEKREGRDPSKPQIFVGEAMRAKLAEWSDGQPQEEQTAMQMQADATGHVLN